MLTAFALRNERLEEIQPDAQPEQLRDALWIVLVDPSEEERARVDSLYQQALPTADEVKEIEATARAFVDENGLHIHSFFLAEVEGKPRNITVAFTLSGEQLFTLHKQDIPELRLLQQRARRQPALISDALSILLALFEIKLDILADRLEDTHADLEQTAGPVLNSGNVDLQRAIDELARHEDSNGKARLCLMDTQRALNFLLRRGRLAGEHAERTQEMLRDIDSLLPHNTFLFDKINFLMDAAQGFINIQQNQIIKIFSVIAVIFLLPTLIASSYGMNFEFMPELSWPWGYPLAISLMAFSGIAPYWYFKRRGWL